MRRLTPYNHRSPLPCLCNFYVRRIRSGRDLYEFNGLRRPGAAPPPKRPSLWARLFGRG